MDLTWALCCRSRSATSVRPFSQAKLSTTAPPSPCGRPSSPSSGACTPGVLPLVIHLGERRGGGGDEKERRARRDEEEERRTRGGYRGRQGREWEEEGRGNRKGGGENERRKGRQPTFSMLAPLSRSSMTSSTLPLQGEERLEGIRGHVHLGWGE